MAGRRPRLLLLLPSTTYRATGFVEAAVKLGVELTVASERTGVLAEREPANLLELDFSDPPAAVRRAVAFASDHPVAAVFGVDDDTAVVAAAIAGALGLSHAPQSALEAARDKHRQRVLLHAGGVPVPDFAVHSLDDDPHAVARLVPYPCVLKPLALSASRGVMRADSPGEFVTAHARLAKILASLDGADTSQGGRYLVEAFVPGPECAIEGLMVNGRLHVLALFDKPDPLDGPFFEETIYVTPSRHPSGAQRELTECAEAAARTIGVTRGPVHVELRHNARGPWLIELAGRPIGGRCGAVLRFGSDGRTSLEELLLGHALGLVPPVPGREPLAAGVSMIPIPRAGILSSVLGLDEARAVEHVTDIVVTAVPGRRLVPLPEGSQYLGFVFARASSPDRVEAALRTANAVLEVAIEPEER